MRKTESDGNGRAPFFTLQRKLLAAVVFFSALLAVNFKFYLGLERESSGLLPAINLLSEQRLLAGEIGCFAQLPAGGPASGGRKAQELAAKFSGNLAALAGTSPAGSVLRHSPSPELEKALASVEAQWEPLREALVAASLTGRDGPSRSSRLQLRRRSAVLEEACDRAYQAALAHSHAMVLGLRNSLIYLFLADILAAVLMLVLARRYLVAPIIRLDKAASEAAAGRLMRVGGPSGRDELGRLVASYNAMVDAIQRDADIKAVFNSLLAIAIERLPMEEMLSRMLKRILSIPWLTIESKGAILTADGSGELEMRAQFGLDGPTLAACAKVPLGRCLCGRAARDRKLVFAADLDPRHEVRYEGITPHGHYCIPIVSKGRLLGVLTVYLKAGHVKIDDDVRVLGAIADLLAGVIEAQQAEEERSRLTETLRQAQKMEAMGLMAGGVAHDFQTILRAIASYLDPLLRAAAECPRNASDIDGIKDAVAKGTSLTRQLLAFSRKQALRLKPVELGEAALGMRKVLEGILGGGVRLEIDPGPGRINADIGQLEQIFINLAANARDAMPEGGRFSVAVSAAALDGSGRGELADARPGAYVLLSVSDTGSGMSETTAGKIFEPFFTTKRPGQGTGLGLSTVYGIVKQSGGYISVESSPGKGTRFSIYFPAV